MVSYYLSYAKLEPAFKAIISSEKLQIKQVE